MQTPIKTGERKVAPSPEHDPARTGHRWRMAIGAAIGTIALVVGLVAWQPWSDPGTAPQSPPAIELSLGEPDALASCLAFEPAMLGAMPMAFEGTVTAVDGDAVTLEVTRWFTTGGAGVVRLIGGHTSPALIAGFDFVPGAHYLISAESGNVNYCGYSGPASAELRAGYEAAFPAG